MAGIVSDDPAAGASLVTVVGSQLFWGQNLVLRIGSALGGQVDLSHVVGFMQGPESVAAAFCSQINANAALRAVNIACQLQSTVIGVTNYTTNLAYPTALTFPNAMVVQQGSPAWDAGPIIFCNRAPVAGVPPPGSSVCQIMMDGPSVATPGSATIQYVMLQGAVVNNNPANIQGELGVYTAQFIQGATLVQKRVNISHGLAVCDSAGGCAQDMGPGTIAVPAGGGFFVGPRAVCVNATSMLFLASGAVCP